MTRVPLIYLESSGHAEVKNQSLMINITTCEVRLGQVLSGPFPPLLRFAVHRPLRVRTPRFLDRVSKRFAFVSRIRNGKSTDDKCWQTRSLLNCVKNVRSTSCNGESQLKLRTREKYFYRCSRLILVSPGYSLLLLYSDIGGKPASKWWVVNSWCVEAKSTPYIQGLFLSSCESTALSRLLHLWTQVNQDIKRMKVHRFNYHSYFIIAVYFWLSRIFDVQSWY